MAWRFRKRIKLFKGVYLNISKKRVSVSFGGKGATMNVSKHGVKATASVTGTGVSYSETLNANTAKKVNRKTVVLWLLFMLVLPLCLFVFYTK